MKRIIKKIEERLVVIISAKNPNNLISDSKYSVELLSAYHKLANYIVPVGPFVLCILYIHKKYVLLEHFAGMSKLISMKNQMTLFCINVQIHPFLISCCKRLLPSGLWLCCNKENVVLFLWSIKMLRLGLFRHYLDLEQDYDVYDWKCCKKRC